MNMQVNQWSIVYDEIRAYMFMIHIPTGEYRIPLNIFTAYDYAVNN